MRAVCPTDDSTDSLPVHKDACCRGCCCTQCGSLPVELLCHPHSMSQNIVATEGSGGGGFTLCLLKDHVKSLKL